MQDGPDDPLYAEKQREREGLAFHEWESLPVKVRVCCRVFDALSIVEQVWTQLQTEEANGLRWIEPELESIAARLDAALKQLRF